MMKPSRFAGQRVAARPFPPARSGLTVSGKNHPRPRLRYFSRKPCLWRRTARKPLKPGMAFPPNKEDYESKRTYQKDSGQQMGKDTRAGRNSSHHIQLALFPRHIACMDRRGHHLFQGTLQVPLPCSLFSRGTGHHSVHTEFSGLLKSDDMEHARNLSLQHKGAVRERAALFVSVTTGNDTGRKGNGLKHRHWQTENYRAKLANASCRTARSGRKRFRKNSSSLRSGIFPENPAFPEAFAVGPL